MKNYYQILDLEPTATPEQIKVQYRFLSHAWHPDKFPNREQKVKAEEKIKEINEAYSVLSDPTKREAYDSTLHNDSASSGQTLHSRPSPNSAEAQSKQICESCGLPSDTKYIEFYENIGLIIFRQHKSIKGHLCKSCINYYFWSLTGKTMLFGWWGVISFIVTPFILLNNIWTFIFTSGMKKNLFHITPDPSPFWVFSTIGGFLVSGFIFSIFLLSILSSFFTQPTYSPPPTTAPIPTRISRPTATTTHALPPPTPACLKWDEVTPQMEGQVVCVYGVVLDHIENIDSITGAIGQTYFYFGRKDQFFLTSLYLWNPTEGICISETGLIQLNTYEVPYIKIEGDLDSCP